MAAAGGAKLGGALAFARWLAGCPSATINACQCNAGLQMPHASSRRRPVAAALLLCCSPSLAGALVQPAAHHRHCRTSSARDERARRLQPNCSLARARQQPPRVPARIASWNASHSSLRCRAGGAGRALLAAEAGGRAWRSPQQRSPGPPTAGPPATEADVSAGIAGMSMCWPPPPAAANDRCPAGTKNPGCLRRLSSHHILPLRPG